MVIFVHVWLTQHLFWFTSRLPSCPIKAENLETQFLRLPCSWGAGMWPSFPQPIALTQDSDVKVSSVRSGHRLAEWTTGWETGPSRKHRGRGVKSSGEMGRNFARSVPNTMGGDWQVSVAELSVWTVLQWVEAFLGFCWIKGCPVLSWVWVAFKLDSLDLSEHP